MKRTMFFSNTAARPDMIPTTMLKRITKVLNSTRSFRKSKLFLINNFELTFKYLNRNFII